jgi:hypothetical protein
MFNLKDHHPIKANPTLVLCRESNHLSAICQAERLDLLPRRTAKLPPPTQAPLEPLEVLRKPVICKFLGAAVVAAGYPECSNRFAMALRTSLRVLGPWLARSARGALARNRRRFVPRRLPLQTILVMAITNVGSLDLPRTVLCLLFLYQYLLCMVYLVFLGPPTRLVVWTSSVETSRIVQ